MPVWTRHLALDRQSYRRKCELRIPSMECIGVNGPTIVHTGVGSGDPGWVKVGGGAAYVMLDSMGRMASSLY